MVEQYSKPQSIFLEGSLSHESQILVADSETRTEEIIDDDFDGTEDEPAVRLANALINNFLKSYLLFCLGCIKQQNDIVSD